MKKIPRHLRSLPLKALSLAFATVILASWVADGIKGEALFEEWHPGFAEHRFLVLLVVVLLFVGCALWLYRERRAFLGVRTLTRQEVGPHRALILPLSPTNVPLDWQHDGTGGSGELRVGDMVLPGGIDKAIQALKDLRVEGEKKDWTWQQLLRGLAPHRHTLRVVCLLGSPGEKGSHVCCENARRLIKHYLPHVRFLEDEEVDFEDVSALTHCIAQAVRRLKEARYAEEEIVVDVTGGRKTTSIAGAVVTLNSNVTFQYVQAEPGPNAPVRVWSYDMSLESRELV